MNEKQMKHVRALLDMLGDNHADIACKVCEIDGFLKKTFKGAMRARILKRKMEELQLLLCNQTLRTERTLAEVSTISEGITVE